MRPAILLVHALSLSCAIASGQVPQLIMDVWPGAEDSYPHDFAPMNGMVYFAANSPVTGLELWRTDGTAAGTQLLKDINPGVNTSSPYGMIGIDGVLYFRATDADHGGELWKSDGTEAGTVMIKDINPGSASCLPVEMTSLNGLVYFIAESASTGRELWRTDGTEAGTELVYDIAPGSESSAPSDLTRIGDQLFFWANDGVHGTELWRSDGTATGTALVKDLLQNLVSNVPSPVLELNGRAYFAAMDWAHGTELWSTDGTEAGTTLVKNISPSNASTVFGHMRVLNDRLIFSAKTESTGRELWTSDGTEQGTALLDELVPGPGDGMPPGTQPAISNGLFFFVAADTASGYGYELYATDGTTMHMVKDIRTDTLGSTAINTLTPACGGVFFSADDGVHGNEIWFSDGTEAGTHLVSDIAPGEQDGLFMDPAFSGDALFFGADDPINGTEPWICPCAFVGIEEAEGELELVISPSPATTAARISLPEGGPWDLHVIDGSGRSVHHALGRSGTFNLDLTGWSSGSYHVLAMRDGKRALRKLVVVRP